MNDIEVFRLSAEACGYEYEGMIGDQTNVIDRQHGSIPVSYWWNPFTHASDRWQCVEKLLEMGYDLELHHGGWSYARVNTYTPAEYASSCPAPEFPARALAALQEKK